MREFKRAFSSSRGTYFIWMREGCFAGISFSPFSDTIPSLGNRFVWELVSKIDEKWRRGQSDWQTAAQIATTIRILDQLPA